MTWAKSVVPVYTAPPDCVKAERLPNRDRKLQVRDTLKAA